MARSDTPEAAREDFFLFIDEFQNFTTEAFASILSEARKYRLCLTLSHQYIDQLPLEIRQAVFGNVGTLLSFRVGNNDAEILQKEFGNTFTGTQFMDLNSYEIFAKILIDGVCSEPFRATTLPPAETEHFRRDNLIRCSREKFSAHRHIVEEKINRWVHLRDL